MPGSGRHVGDAVRVPAAADPHAGQRVVHRGAGWPTARLAVILLHGRGGAPEDVLALADEWSLSDIAYLAPAAAGHTWYPESFLAPIDRNEPWLTSALRTVERVLAEIASHDVPAERVAILGFSQGGCLGLEFAARHARRYRAVVGLSAGVIGPPETPRVYRGSLTGTPVFLGCSDVDPHIPLSRVRESADVFRRLGGIVDERIYPGMGHGVNRDEVEGVKALLLAR
jgi:predicted esterase